jgi:hypothetical protein
LNTFYSDKRKKRIQMEQKKIYEKQTNVYFTIHLRREHLFLFLYNNYFSIYSLEISYVTYEILTFVKNYLVASNDLKMYEFNYFSHLMANLF